MANGLLSGSGHQMATSCMAKIVSVGRTMPGQRGRDEAEISYAARHGGGGRASITGARTSSGRACPLANYRRSREIFR